MAGTDWAALAVEALRADDPRAELPLRRLRSPYSTVDITAVDASGSPAGGIKYDAVRELFAADIAAGLIGPGTRLVEAAASGTADATAHFSRLLGLRLTLVVPARTPSVRQEELRAYGAKLRLSERPAAMYEEARAYAEECGGHFLDHLVRTAGAVDPGRSRITGGLAALRPQWIVVGVGTGVTSAVVGWYVRDAADVSPGTAPAGGATEAGARVRREVSGGTA